MLLALASFNASGDWQYTRWGMTVDEVIRESKGAAVRANKDGGENYRTLATASYTSSGRGGDRFTFKVEFRFPNDTKRLRRVELGAVDGKRCTEIGWSLNDVYGKPEKVEDYGLVHVTIWRSEKSGNMVSFSHLFKGQPTETCLIHYKPIRKVGASGL